MHCDLAMFEKYGVIADVEGNIPLALIEPEKVYLLYAGKAEVFCVQKFNNETYGSRNHLFSATVGNAVFGFDGFDKSSISYEIQLIGIIDTKVLCIDRKVFFELSKDSAYQYQIVNLIDEWVINLSNCLSDAMLPKNSMVIEASPETVIPKETPFHTVDSVLWVTHLSGFSTIMGKDDYIREDQKEFFPLTEYSWMIAMEDITILVKQTSDLLALELLWKMLLKFNRIAVDLIQLKIDLYKNLEKQRLGVKLKNDTIYIHKAISGLANILEGTANETFSSDPSEDNLFRACFLVGKCKGINIIHPAVDNDKELSKDVIGNIARTSRIRYRSIILKGEWWKEDNGPFLAFLEEDKRPVAIIPVSPHKYELIDPSTGEKKSLDSLTISKLYHRAFVFYRPLSNKRIGLKDIVKYGIEGTWKRDLLILLLLGMGSGLLGMTIPIVSGILFDTVIPQGERDYLWQIAIFLFTGTLSGIALQIVRSFAMMRLESQIDADIQAAIWDRLIGLPVSFFKDYSAGELSMKAMSINKIKRKLSGSTITTILSGVFSVFNLALMFFYSARLAKVALALILVSIAVTSYLGYLKVRHEGVLTNLSNKLSGFVLQIMEGIPKLKIAGAENRVFYLWSKQFSGLRKITFKSETMSNWIDTFNSILPIVASATIFFFYAGNAKEKMSAGYFIAFNAAFVSFFTIMVVLSSTIIDTLSIIPLCKSINPILKATPEYDEDKLDPGELNGQIEVSNVSFRYKENDPLVLENISLTINPGEYVAIVGPSGCGKSTLFRTLLGFEKLESGQIYYDGQDINKVDIRGIRRQIGVVLQNGKLLTGDIFTNIVGANPNLTIDDAWEAAKASGLDDDISKMPMGLHTVIGEGTSTLSGGQRQRLLIARAIVNKPRIVFFDEATSALDNKTQKVVSESLDKINATRIVIAHRLSTIISCDKIIVMDKGRIVECGEYNELISIKGVFYDMAQRQLA